MLSIYATYKTARSNGTYKCTYTLNFRVWR